MYPYTCPSLRAVSRFFTNIVDREPLPQVYIPELNDFTDIRRVSVRKIMRLKGKNSGAIVRLREIINSVQWVSAWLSFIAAGYGWFFITHIYWKQKSQHYSFELQLSVHILSPFLFSHVTIIIELHGLMYFNIIDS